MEDDYERPAYLDMSPMDLATLGEPMAYTDMGDTLTAENVSAKYRMSVDEAQSMIDAGAVESGGILFVNAEARDAFYTAIGGVDPSNPFADAYAAVMRDEVARAETSAALDNDIPGAFFDALGDAMDDGVAGFPDNNVPEGSQYTDTELCDLLNGIPDDDESYANKVNAPLTEDEAHEIGRQIKSGDYPRYKRAAPRQWTQNEALAEKMLANGGVEDCGITFVSPEARDKFYAAANDPGMDEYTPDDEPSYADGTGGTTAAPPIGFGFIECANIEGQLWSSIAGDHEPEHAADPMFYIWSNKHQLYWGPNRKGYVAWPSQAGRYTAVEASAIINHSMRGIILGNNRAVPDAIMLPVPDTIPAGAE